MDTLAVFSAADGLCIHRLPMEYAMRVLLGFASEFFRSDQIINGTSNRFIGLVAEDAGELSVGAPDAVLHIEKNNGLRRLFKQFIQLGLLCTQLLAASEQVHLRMLALGDIGDCANEL